MSDLQVFICGRLKDHKCNHDGDEMLGGDDWQMKLKEATEENKRMAKWGSVSCSICGMTAMESDMWSDHE